MKKNTKRILYHYCSLKTLESITEESCLRLTNIMQSNDSLEMIYGFNIFRQSIIAGFLREKTKYFKERINQNDFTNVIDTWVERYKKRKDLHCFVLCFSSNGDLLSQWRGYANDGKGVAIGITEAYLEEFAKKNSINLAEVCYAEKTQKSRLRRVSEKIIREIKNKIRCEETEIKELINEVLDNNADEILCEIISFKTTFFKEENEWRLFVFENKLDSSKHLKGYSTEDNYKLYISLNFPRLDDLKIVLGPKCLAQENDIKRLIEPLGENVNVEKSLGTYR